VTKDELRDLLGIADEDVTDDEAVWPVIVAFVAEWFDRVPAVIAHPYDVEQVKRYWEKEMT
jgi:hypothetical protein